MKKKAINALLEMGMPANLKGFQYISDAMEMFEDKTWKDGKITVLYYELGKRNNSTASRVERAIRHAFGFILTKGNLESVEKYLTLQSPTNGNLLHVFYLRLMQEG